MGTFHEKIASVCLAHFNGLPKTGKPTETEWTVLSCIVKEDTGTSDLEVVSLGTGSKCMGKSKMSPNGDVLNDSHAEVVCRRTFLLYLYEQIRCKNENIFEFDRASSRVALRANVAFHFFTTHSPCGDAAIFPKTGCQPDDELGQLLSCGSPAVKRRKVDTFRTGAKCLPDETKQDPQLPGSDYHILGAVRTKPGRGDPTLSVSCSDKLARWCHLGVQGALMSLVIEAPIYLKSFTVAGGTPYSKEALLRALYNRLPPSCRNENSSVTIGQALTAFPYCKNKNKQPCPATIAWCKIKSRPLEVAVEGRKQGVTKKQQNTKAGRLQICKIELYRRFLATVQQLQLPLFEDKNLSVLRYCSAKSEAKNYQEMWNRLREDGFGIWSTKGDSMSQFVVD